MGTPELDPIDLIHLGGGEGNSVVLRLAGRFAPIGSPNAEILVGEIIVGSGFVSGGVATWVFPEDLASWEEAMAALAGGESVSWRKDKRATEIHIDLEQGFERATVSVADRQGSLARVEVTVDLAEDWLSDHHARLDSIRRRWPVAGT
jgi:hypothetical protein